jgi:hypothetical protein
MGFVSDRLYAAISRREFTHPNQPDCLWGVSKVVHTPAALALAHTQWPGGVRSRRAGACACSTAQHVRHTPPCAAHPTVAMRAARRHGVARAPQA